MKSEIEVKFVDVDIADMRKKLQKIGAVCRMQMRQMNRVIIDYPDRRMQQKEWAFIRVRDEQDKVTLTYKRFDKLSVDGAKEVEVAVSDFDSAVQIFEAIGLEVVSFQEARRETWGLGEAEIVIDEWPWLKPYIEIEADSENTLKEIAKKLGCDWDTAIFGDVMQAYRAQYPHLDSTRTVGELLSVRFDDPLPEMLQK